MLRDVAEESDRISSMNSDEGKVIGASQATSGSEPSWARTCLYDHGTAAAAAADQEHDGPIFIDVDVDMADTTARSPVQDTADVPAMQLELEHWEIELAKLQGSETEEEETLMHCLKAKVEALKSELRTRDALLGSSYKGYLASLDAKFAAARMQATSASASASAAENACSCCGIIMKPGAAVPEGCVYRTKGVTHFPIVAKAAGARARGSVTSLHHDLRLEMTQRVEQADEELFGL
jgi:hypothetical protein